MVFPHLLFKHARLNATDVANLIGVSRVTGYRWLQGAGVNVLLQKEVERILPALTKAVEIGALPNTAVSKLPPAKRAKKIKSILRNVK